MRKCATLALIAFLVGCGGETKERDPRCDDWTLERYELLAAYDSLRVEMNAARDLVISSTGEAMADAMGLEMTLSVKRIAVGNKLLELQDVAEAAGCEF